MKDHNTGCATQANADDFGHLGCTCGADKENTLTINHNIQKLSDLNPRELMQYKVGRALNLINCIYANHSDRLPESEKKELLESQGLLESVYEELEGEL